MPLKDPAAAKAYQDAYYQKHKEAKKAKRRARYHLQPAVVIARMRQWRQDNPERYQAIERRYRAKNKEKIAVRVRAYRTRNRVKLNALSLRYKIRKRGAAIADFTEMQWQTILLVFQYRCAYCKRKFKKLTQDHITPLSKKGNHTLSNIVPACHSCNAKKNNRAVLSPVQPLLL